MIYLPHRYPPSYSRDLPPDSVELEYRTRAGRQVAFYIAPRQEPDRPPNHLWVMFGGNAAVALGWLHLIDAAPDRRVGFLLIDYPGFGKCEGQATRDAIRESTEAALSALAWQLRVRTQDFEGRMSALGHSLGSAVALEFSPHHELERVILLSPFTSMCDMARHYIGWTLDLFVQERYDNQARLAELADINPRPSVIIIHGDADTVVPVWMGRELARRYPDWIIYHEIHRGTHHSFMTTDQALILSEMFPPDHEKMKDIQ